MPLNLRVMRDGMPVTFEGGFDHHVLNAVYTAALKEQAADWQFREDMKVGELPKGIAIDLSMAPIYYMGLCDLMTKGEQVLRNDHTFGQERVIELKAGDELVAWRSSARDFG